MKIKYLFITILIAITVLSLAACDLSWLPIDIPGITDKTPDETPDDGKEDEGGAEEELEGLVLIKDGKANFRIVYTADAGVSSIKAATDFVTTLRSLGVEIEDAIDERDADSVTECEIIVGPNARNRGEECNVSDKYLGAKGYVVKTVGKRVVIAGGCAEMTKKTFDSFVQKQLKITGKTESITSLAIAEDLFEEKLTTYLLKSISVAGNDLRDYTLIVDVDGMGEFGSDNIRSFREALYAESGYWLQSGTKDEIDSYEHKMIIRYSKDITADNGDGFVAYVDDSGDFIIECAYANVFDKTFGEYVNECILSEMGELSFPSDYKDTEPASKVYYSDFGAKGDGKSDDYQAIYDAHVFANQCGQTVYADKGATYYTHIFTNGAVPVLTNVELGDAKIIVDDTGSEIYAQRALPLYRLVRDHDTVTYNEAKIKELFGNATLAVGQEKIDWLVGTLEAESMIRITNSKHKDYVRNGGNLDSGYNRMDTIIVDKDGNVDPDNPIVFEFKEITKLEIIRTDDKPITFNGGYIETICCKVVPETRVNKYHSYSRGITISRSNATVSGVTHRMVDEPILDTTSAAYGERKESYPYHAFLDFSLAYNCKAEDMDLTGHTTYYEDKTTSQTPVPMGSYDIVVMYSLDITFNKVVQNGVPIADEKYWGIMASNGVKNIEFYDSEISRFDAHRGFWNGKLINCELGHSFNVIGGGLLEVVNTRKQTGNWFISLRGDYGATFEGDIILKDCTMLGYKSYNSNRGGSASTTVASENGVIISSGYSYADEEYLNWDFGFVCYMPQNILIDNFKYHTRFKNVYVYNNIGDTAFSADISNPYILTKSITYKNMAPLKTVANTQCYKLNNIPVKVEE